jgi:LuxR family maltose regulon positive regulatory protein
LSIKVSALSIHAGKQFVKDMLAAQLPPPDYLVDVMISDMAVLNKTLVLVLDDYSTIESEPVKAIVIRMVQYLPAGLHLVISTRIDPPWPAQNPFASTRCKMVCRPGVDRGSH